MKNNNLTEGSIVRNLIYLAWPIVIAMSLQTSFNIIDAIFVGRLGADALAAVSMSFPVLFFIIAISVGIGSGTTALVARFVGANRLKDASNTAEHSLIIGAAISIIMTALGIIFAKPLFAFLGADEQLMPLVLDYAVILFYGTAFFVVGFIANSVLRGEGDTRTPMWIMIISVALNAILDPIMIFGWFGFPALGVKGAAIATVITRGAGFFIAFCYLFKGKAMVKLHFQDFRLNHKLIRDIFKIGIPTSLSNALISISLLFITKIVAGFGNAALAAYGIGARLDSFIYMPLIGLTSAVVTLVGQNLGAEQYERAEKTTNIAIYVSIFFSAIVGATMFFFPKIFVLLFNSEPEVVMYASSYLKIIAPTNIFFGIVVATSAAFLGAGDAVPPFILTFLRTIAISIPLAYLLSLYLGLTGVWIGMATSNIVVSIMSYAWYRKGRWKHKKLESF